MLWRQDTVWSFLPEQTWVQLSHLSHCSDRQTVECVGKNFVFVIAFRSNLPSPPKLIWNVYHGLFTPGWNLCISYLKIFGFSQIFQMNVVHTNSTQPLHLQYLPCHFTGLISHLFHIRQLLLAPLHVFLL